MWEVEQEMKCKCKHPIIEVTIKNRHKFPRYTRLGFYHLFKKEDFFDKQCYSCNCTKPEPVIRGGLNKE